ncbi:MAG: excinuclease ABC subunit UvrC, partial [Nitrosopumilaceae archaeon]
MTFDISKIHIPSNPGIYLMKDSDEKIIYIGKAKNLKNRVKSYFLKNQNYKTQKLVENIADIEFVLTDNESEAFLLESNMIKKYRPRFNIELKDQQRYTYLRISDEKYPRLLVARRTRDGKFLGKGKIFGPFTQGSSKLLTIGTLRKAFQIRICKTLPKKVCLEYHLGNCEGPCEFKDAQERYPQHVAALEEVLRGKNQTKIFTEKLKEEMQQAADLQQFERAKEIRDTLIRLGSLQTKQKMEYVENSDEEYFGMGEQDQVATVMNFRMINGVIRDSDKFFFDLVGDNSFSNFLFQYYSTHKIPKFILVSEMPDNKDLLESLLSEQAGFSVRIHLPQRGKRREIIDLILKNIQLIHTKGGNPGLVELKEILGLPVI